MFGKNSLSLIWVVLLAFHMIACTQPKSKSVAIDPLDKINFDLSRLNEEGLLGPPDGLRALSYEFCIPADETFALEVKSIDPTLNVAKESSGRIGCSDSEYLCVGNTHQKNYRRVLFKLANLKYVNRIEQSFFEN